MHRIAAQKSESAYLDMEDPKLMGRVIHILELMRMFSAYTGDPQYEALGIKYAHNKEITMLAGLKEYIEEKEKEGKKEGKKELTAVLANLFKQGRVNDVQRAVDDPDYLNKIMAEFGYSNDDEEADKQE